jgi:cathepsin L
MLKNFLFALSVALVAAKPSWRELQGYTFEKFVSDFHIDVKAGTPEYSDRKAIFNAELARVTAHNSANASWKESVNHMSAMTATEKQAFYGRNKASATSHQPAYRSALQSSHFPMKDASELPTDVDWRHSGVVSAVKDQGSCGSCWAFAATAVMESHIAIASGNLFDLSPQQIAACSPNPNHCGGSGNCKGATAEIAFDYASGSAGLLEEFQYGYTEYFAKESDCAVPSAAIPKGKISGYVKLGENNYNELLNAVAQVGPIAVSVDASTWSGMIFWCIFITHFTQYTAS